MGILQQIAKKLQLRQCPECNSFNTERSIWARGWNNWCQQAYGDWGIYCNHCRKVTFDKPLEEHLKTLPTWCTPNR